MRSRETGGKERLEFAETALEGLDMLLRRPFRPSHTVAELEADPIGAELELRHYYKFRQPFWILCGIAVPVPAPTMGAPANVTTAGRCRKDAEIAASGLALEAAGQRKIGSKPIGRSPVSHPKPAAKPTA